jgi:L-methionine (R)-S-oxide reductase
MPRVWGNVPSGKFMNADEKRAAYQETMRHIRSLIEGETDEIAVMATVAAELHHGLRYFNWVGFYRVTRPGLLKVGPYQGGHGCLTIPFERGVCGKCAREKATQLVADVTKLPYHIACSGTTRAEIVVPVLDSRGEVRAVLDVDSDTPGAFDEVDRGELETLAKELRRLWP